MTQSEALTILKTGANAFLTGSPGSGKTHTINQYIEWLRESGIEPSVTAATGIAATHVGGMTLHSWSGIGIKEQLSQMQLEEIAQKEHVARRINKAKVLIIDEISMLSAATFAAAESVCREVRRSELPFGGLQVIMVGDFFQLPPISGPGRQVEFAYDSPVWRELNPLVCYITEQYRQDDDDFLALLGAIRSGEVEEMHYELLAARRDSAVAKGAPRLYSHNADVDRENAAELAKLPGKSRKSLMVANGREVMIDALKRGCLSPELLELKEDAEVMFTKNSPQGRFVNGTLGRVTSFDSSGLPIVETRDGETIVAERMEWQVEEGGKIRASISQVPLRLAYAMTVHKSQGMSMDAAVIDLSRAFEYGQGYVALSRVRRLSGLHLLGLNQRALEVHPQVLEKDRDFRAASEAAREAFSEMPPAEVEALQKQFIKALGGAWATTTGKISKKAGKRSALAGRLAETLTVVREAKSLHEAANKRGFTESTIVRHLEELANAGKLVRADYEHLLPEQSTQDEIREALASVPEAKLAPVFGKLGGRYSFETIRLVRLAYQ